MDRVEYAFAVTTLTGFLVLIACLSWLLLIAALAVDNRPTVPARIF
jgi:hypothetical protein